MRTRVFVDTNVFVYIYDATDSRKRERALEIMLDDDLELVISTQVLAEFYVTVTRKLRRPLSAADAHTALEHLAGLEVVPVTRNLVVDAARTAVDHQLSFWDAQIVEAASRSGVSRLLTEDLATDAVLRDVEVVNPFV